METLKGLKRTHKCAELGEQNIGQEVVVMGWTQVYRQLGALTFIDLRDISGIVQLSFSEDFSKEAFEKYASGEIDAIEEFDVELLDHLRPGTRGKMPRLNVWSTIASPSVI